MESAAEANHLSSTASIHYIQYWTPRQVCPSRPRPCRRPGAPRLIVFRNVCVGWTAAVSTWRPGAPGNNVARQLEGRPAIARSGQWQPLHQSSNMADIRTGGRIGRCLYLAVASAAVTVTVSDLRNRVDLTSSREGRPGERERVRGPGWEAGTVWSQRTATSPPFTTHQYRTPIHANSRPLLFAIAVAARNRYFIQSFFMFSLKMFGFERS